ncbi:MAG: permease prefix domain 1-containing protein [Treponema sp.]|uniref:permease prefix domain 1-containing protein n=1 Tax=Treponema sp. TaxID=166 RepID=UPI003FA2AB04
MSKKIAEYVNFIFRNAPNTREAMELKEEIENNVSDKYNKLVAGGLDEEQAFSKAIASIGNIDELLDELKHSAEKAAFTDDDKKQTEEKKKWCLMRSIFRAVAIMLFILGPIALIFISEVKSDEVGLLAMFLCIATGVGILVFLSSFESKAGENGEDNIKQSFSEYRNHYKPKRRLFRKMKSLVWLCAVVVYFLISFSTRRWDITWITFIIAGIGVSILDIGMDED